MKAGGFRNINVPKIAIILITTLLQLSFIVQSAYASTHEELISNGKAAFEAGEYKEAEGLLREAIKEAPENHTANLYLGMALSRMGGRANLNEAESYLKHALYISPDDALTNLELGKIYFNKDVHLEALDFFEGVIEYAPRTDMSGEAIGYLKRIYGLKDKKKPWALQLSSGFQYDSNVILKSDVGPLPAGISKKSDWRALVMLAGSYTFVKTKNSSLSVGYSHYSNYHNNLDKYNVNLNSLKLGGSIDPNKNLRIKLLFSYDNTQVDNTSFSESNSASVVSIYSWGRGHYTMLNLQYADLDYIESKKFRGNSNRTGDSSGISIVQRIPLTERANLSLGYAREKVTAKEAYQEYIGDKYFGDLGMKLPWKLNMNLGMKVHTKNYWEAVNPVSPKYRKDTNATYTIVMGRELSKTWSVELSEAYIVNESNIPVFDYRRNIMSAFLKAGF